MNIEEAINLILTNTKFNVGSEVVSLENALDRVPAQDVVAVKNLPSFDNSALDGYAIKFDEFNEPLSVAGTILAGDTRQISLKSGECMKIMTGAKMPANTDTIVPFESAIIEAGKLAPNPKIKKFNAVRYKGEEVKTGETLLKSGERLSAQSVMMLAAQGIYCVSVRALPSIGIFSSGDEVIEPWQSASEEQIYNANAAGIATLLQSRGFKSSYAGIIKDELQSTMGALAGAKFDVVICSGGASKGEADFMKTALLNLGFSPLLDGVNVRPGGRPSKIYTNGEKVVFILPGNPMAAFLMCFLLVLPFLKGEPNKTATAILAEDLKVKSGRQNILLGSFKNGEFHVTDGGKFGSGMIRPLIKSNAILITDESQSELKAGETTKIYAIS